MSGYTPPIFDLRDTVSEFAVTTAPKEQQLAWMAGVVELLILTPTGRRDGSVAGWIDTWQRKLATGSPSKTPLSIPNVAVRHGVLDGEQVRALFVLIFK